MMTKDIIMKLFESWKGPGKLNNSLFTDDFIYNCGSDVHTTDVWINTDNGDELIDAEILEVEASDAEGKIIFKFKDPVTLLEHTTTWNIKCSDGRIKGIIES